MLDNLQFKNVIMILTNEIKEILENIVYWDSCPQDYKDKINSYLTSEYEPKALNIDLVSGYYYLKDGDSLMDGDEYYENDFDDMWITVTDPSESDVFNSNTYYKTRRKI